MAKRTDAVIHQQVDKVFGEELKSHGIGVREFMMGCAIKLRQQGGLGFAARG